MNTFILAYAGASDSIEFSEESGEFGLYLVAIVALVGYIYSNKSKN